MRGKVPQSPLDGMVVAVAGVALRELQREGRVGVVTLARDPPGRIQFKVQGVVPKNTRRLPC